MSNKYRGVCHACGCSVGVNQGKLEYVGGYRSNQLWCMDCFNKSDNSGEEDRCCGDRAYEDRCAEQCGF